LKRASNHELHSGLNKLMSLSQDCPITVFYDCKYQYMKMYSGIISTCNICGMGSL
jgi:hypothetical protein